VLGIATFLLLGPRKKKKKEGKCKLETICIINLFLIQLRHSLPRPEDA